MEALVGHTDTERLDWLEKNASRLGIKPDWRWCKVGKSTGWVSTDEMSEHTDIRGKIDEMMSNMGEV